MTSESLAELDELKAAWRALERRLDREQVLNRARFARERLSGVRGALRPLVAGQIAQAIFGVVLVGWYAAFWVAQLATPHLLAVGVLGHVWSISMIAFAVRELFAISRLDYAAPVLAIQKQIAELRARRVRVATYFAITSCFMWIPPTLVFLRSFGVDLWAEQPDVVAWFVWAERPGVVAWLVASSLAALVPLLVFLRWSRNPARARLAKRVDDTLVGRSVLRAESMLAELAEFERE
ncbi:MAG TPA: hypothetical protein VII78_05115 [Myxococcota bacterium]